ncbi:uncharacterized protein B0H64DRAFT_389301 [Chaetomium fimeti]|uniref:Uncharacterized protein n=1 Tax=Chaetomium fimeti TaxID=1854472 RepID=A0AAE0HND2_9PEZI|nr:hypothetical protein B0H64DRAFT_389301 [Chaetomium fimeti]
MAGIMITSMCREPPPIEITICKPSPCKVWHSDPPRTPTTRTLSQQNFQRLTLSLSLLSAFLPRFYFVSFGLIRRCRHPPLSFPLRLPVPLNPRTPHRRMPTPSGCGGAWTITACRSGQRLIYFTLMHGCPARRLCCRGLELAPGTESSLHMPFSPCH